MSGGERICSNSCVVMNCYCCLYFMLLSVFHAEVWSICVLSTVFCIVCIHLVQSCFTVVTADTIYGVNCVANSTSSIWHRTENNKKNTFFVNICNQKTDQVDDCCIRLSDQYYSYIMVRTSYFLMWWSLCFTNSTRLVNRYS